MDVGQRDRREEALARAKARDEADFRRRHELSAADYMYWLRNCTETYDDQAAARGVEVYKPFPDKAYLALLMQRCSDPEETAIVVPKSREMMTSWLVMGYAAALCQFKLRAQVICQSQKEDKVQKLIGYAKCLYDRQPEWFRKKHPLKRGALTSEDQAQSKDSLVWASGSEIIGVPSGADQIRSYHPTVYIMDEGAHLDEAGASYDAARPVVPKIIIVSSAGPGWFADICDEEVAV